jgi:hypothetical protein
LNFDSTKKEEKTIWSKKKNKKTRWTKKELDKKRTKKTPKKRLSHWTKKLAKQKRLFLPFTLFPQASSSSPPYLNLVAFPILPNPYPHLCLLPD